MSIERVSIAAIEPDLIIIDMTPMSEWGEDMISVTAIAFEKRADYSRKVEAGFARIMRSEISLICECGNRDSIGAAVFFAGGRIPCSADCGRLMRPECIVPNLMQRRLPSPASATRAVTLGRFVAAPDSVFGF